MKSFQTRLFIFLPILALLIFGCNNSDSSKTKNSQKKATPLVGTWQQTAIGKKEVTDIVVKTIFSERTMTMDAPGCMIIGDYTVAKDILTYTVTAVQGQRCSKSQMIGKSDSVRFVVKGAQLIMTPLAGGEESQVVYQRIIK